MKKLLFTGLALASFAIVSCKSEKSTESVSSDTSQTSGQSQLETVSLKVTGMR